MNTVRHRVAAFALALLAGLVSSAVAAIPPITYQGQLKFEGVPFNGLADLSFALYDRVTEGTRLCTYEQYDVEVVNGLFTVELNLTGTDCFNGDPRWLEIAVRTPDGTATLEPRQPITPAPYALYAYNAPGGSTLWHAAGSDIYYEDGNVGVGTDRPSHPLHVVDQSGEAAVVGENPRESTMGELGSEQGGVYGEGGVAVKGVTRSETGKGVHGAAMAIDGANYGVYGESASRGGHGVYGQASSADGGIGVYGGAASSRGFGGYFDGRGYFSDRVGIGVTNPGEMLEVGGTAKMTGIRLGTSATPGHVLTTNASGVGTWQAPSGGGSSVWGDGPEDHIYYNDGNVGIGTGSTQTPVQPLHVEGNGYFSGNVGIGKTYPTKPLDISGDARVFNGNLYLGAEGFDPYIELMSDENSDATEIRLKALDGVGFAVTNSTDTPLFVVEQSGDVGIGTTAPEHPLHVTSSTGSAIFGVGLESGQAGVHGKHIGTNGRGVFGEVTGTGGYGVYGKTVNGAGVYGVATTDTGGKGVEGYSESDTGYAVYGFNEGGAGDAVGVYGETASPYGRGVYGYATADTASTSYGVYGRADSTWGRGVYGQGNGASGYGGYFEGRGYFSGNVGIGTAPTETDLEVADDVKADAFKYRTPKERTLTIPIFAFRPAVSDYVDGTGVYIFGVNWTSGELLFMVSSYPSAYPLVAPVNLPNGAEITEVKAYAIDEDPDADFEVWLYRMALLDEFAEDMATATSSGSTGPQIVTAPAVVYSVIDNTSWAYYLTIGVEEGQDWDDSVRPRAVVITYTVDETD